MTTTNTNGRTARKSLADQIDRLDAILDGLADNLNEAVASAVAGAVREAVAVAVREAVQVAVLEVLTNPELRQRLAVYDAAGDGVVVPPVVGLVEVARRCWDRLADAARDTWRVAGRVAKAVAARVAETVRGLAASARVRVRAAWRKAAVRARTGLVLTLMLATLARRFRTQLLVAAGAGVLVGLLCYLAGRELAAAGCGVAGFAASLAGVAARSRVPSDTGG